MALPATDNFNRASLGANWTLTLNTMAINASTDFVGQVSVDTIATWNADTFGNDQEAECTLTNISANTHYAGVVVRSSGGTGYAVGTDGGSGATHTGVFFFNGATFTTLKDVATSWVAGDKIKLRIVGTTWTLFKNGVQVDTGSDSTKTSGGAPGIYAFNNAGRGDNWTGDNFPNTVAGVGTVSRLFSNPGAGPFMAARFPGFVQGVAPTTVTVQIGQPWFFWQPQERIEAEEDIYRQPNHQLLHRYRFNFQTVGQSPFLMRWRTSTPETPELYDVLAAPPLLHRYRQSFQTVGQSYRLWPISKVRLEPEDYTPTRPADLSPFRQITSVTTGGQPWYFWQRAKIDWDIEVATPKANHDLLHRYRFNFQTVGQSWLYRIKPQTRLDDEPNAPAKIADLTPFRGTAPTVQAGQPWFIFAPAKPDLTIEPDAVRTDHAATMEPFRPHQATEPIIVIVSPEPSGSVPGWVPDSEGRLHGPYKRPGQVFGETFPISPDLGIPPAIPATLDIQYVSPLERMSEGIDVLTLVESQESRARDQAIAVFALWAMMESDDR